MQKKLRLRNKQDFSRVYSQGRSFANAQFVVYWRKQADPGCFRLGISASSKLGGAVVRNRMRRVIKEIVRLNAARLQDGYDLILIVRKPALAMSYRELERSIMHVLRKAGLLRGMSSSEHGTVRKSGRNQKPNRAKKRKDMKEK